MRTFGRVYAYPSSKLLLLTCRPYIRVTTGMHLKLTVAAGVWVAMSDGCCSSSNAAIN